MTTTTAIPVHRNLYRALCIALIGIYAWRVLEIAPRWAAGVAPAYAGQYQSRLFNAIVGVGLLGAVLVTQSTVGKTPRGRLAYWGLLCVAVGVLLVQIITNR